MKFVLVLVFSLVYSVVFSVCSEFLLFESSDVQVYCFYMLVAVFGFASALFGRFGWLVVCLTPLLFLRAVIKNPEHSGSLWLVGAAFVTAFSYLGFLAGGAAKGCEPRSVKKS